MKKLTIKQILLILLIGVTCLIASSLIWWITGTYEPSEVAKQALISDETVMVTLDEHVIFTPQESVATKGFILYPGAQVNAQAYAPLAHQLAKEGVLVVLVNMPLQFAMLNIDAAQEVMDQYPDIDSWVIGGHSLGGVAASSFAATHDDIDGIVFLAAYPGGDELQTSTIAVTSIYGSLDGVLNMESLEMSKNNLPKHTQFIEIEGGNHAQFGDYGMQSGDLKATLSAEEQVQRTVEAILNQLN